MRELLSVAFGFWFYVFLDFPAVLFVAGFVSFIKVGLFPASPLVYVYLLTIHHNMLPIETDDWCFNPVDLSKNTRAPLIIIFFNIYISP